MAKKPVETDDFTKDLQKLDAEQSEIDKRLVAEGGFTEEELSGLSDAEKEGLLDTGEGDADEAEDKTKDDAGKEAAEKAAAEAKAKADQEAADKAAADKAASDKAVADKAAADAAATAAAKAGEPPVVVPDAEILTFRPVVLDSEITVPDEVPEEFKKQLAELSQKFDDGDIEKADYETARDAINRKVFRAQDSVLAQMRSDKIWEKEQTFFLSKRPEYLAKDIKGDAMFGALGKRVEALSSDPKNAHLTGVQLLVLADRDVKAAFGIVAQPKPEEKKADAGKPPEPLPNTKTLADVPAAGANSVGDAFSQLDNLKGEAYEAALEKLSPEVRAAYMRRV